MKKKTEEFRQLIIRLVVAAMLLSTVAFTGSSFATEGGGGIYANGAEDFMAGALPPPGTYFKNYLNYYHASEFKGNNGHDMIPDFELDVVADVFRFLHVTKYKVFGADWGMHVMIPVVYQDIALSGEDDDRFGLGDIMLTPFLLGWHFKNLHIAAAVEVSIPVGTYDEKRLANAGRNYWTFEPVLAITYLSDSGFELSSKFMYDFNLENDDTDYKSGQEFHFDATIGYHINKQWAVGINGYYYCQTTEDELNGKKNAAHTLGEGRVFAVGPAVNYAYKNMNFALKWQPEFEAENKPEGDKFWFNFVYHF